jgi:alpha-galactosidase
MRNWRTLLAGAVALAAAAAGPAAPRNGVAPTPPMGWNSWDAYGFTIDEAQFRANIERLARLRQFGWTYAVIDEGWYMADPLGKTLAERAYLLDGNGRLMPVPARFPSATGGDGLRALAAWTHAQGLKFGIHIVRGIPKAAVEANMPIAGSAYRAADAADRAATCPWDDGNYGVADNAAGQAWYDSLAQQYAGWGVDFLKVDCIADHPYRPTEIRQIGEALRKAGRPIVLSLSPGPSRVANVEEMARWAQMWRIADDLWDGWTFPHADPTSSFPNGIRSAFDNLAAWSPYAGPERWPDADMLPFGSLRPHAGWGDPRQSRLTLDEARTAMTLWSIARSPLILGANLTELDPGTASLLENPAVIALDQQNRRPHPIPPLPDLPDLRVWTSAPVGGAIDTVAVFNLADHPLDLRLTWSRLGLPAGRWSARELWTGTDLPPSTSLTHRLPPHGTAVFRIKRG